MKILITNIIMNDVKKDLLIIDDKLVKISNKINELVDKKIDGTGLYAINGFANCYFDGSVLDSDKLLCQGITTVFDFSNEDEVTKKLIEMGLNVYKAVGDFDGNNVIDEEYLDNKVDESVKLGTNQIILFVANPNIEDESQYSAIIQYAKKHGFIIATSVSENLEDVGEIDKQFNMSPIALLESYGFLDYKNLLIDCVCVDKDDVNILTNYDSTICVCPTKNLKSGSGIAPTYSFLKNNINVVIGGVNSSMFQEIDLCKNLQSGYLNEKDVLSEDDVINMAVNNVNELINNKNLNIVLVDEPEILKCTPLNVRLSIINNKVVYNVLNE